MCLYPKLIRNKKYLATKKNGGNVPIPPDPRVMWVPIACQKCMECRKQKARQWSIRLQEHLKTATEKQFVTLTFSNESIQELITLIHKQTEQIPERDRKQLTGYDLDNEIATIAVRRFLERWRKKYKKSVEHWLVTELGQGKHAKHRGTENIHLHGIIFNNNKEEIETKWQYGFVYFGQYVNEQTVNYCVKYFTKVDQLHKEYNAKILTSPGIGNNYTNTLNAQLNTYKATKTKETYTTRQGTKINLPIYYRNKIYTEQQREQLWLQKLDQKIRWVDGTKISIAKDYTAYDKTLQQARAKNKRLGYGNDEINWERKQYENQRRQLLIQKRIQSGQIQ